MLAGGLGLFLFGIKIMGDGLEHAAGSKMKKLLEKLTTNRFLAVLVGFLVTAVIQSSSATTVMVVGFVNAGLMNLIQAAGVIMGANIGTTTTSVLIALNFSSIAPVAVFVGMALITFAKKNLPKHIGSILVGFGMLFVGMGMMSDAMKPLRESTVFAAFIQESANPIIGILIGLVMTAVIQSSSASVGILQALASQGLVPIHVSIYVLFGQNIGTCVTALLASIGTKKNSKRAVLIHFLFNIIGTILFLVLNVVTRNAFGELLLRMTDEPAAQIAYAHIIFNVVTTIVMLPFMQLLVKASEKLIPGRDKGEQELRLEFLDEHMLVTPMFAMGQLSKEVGRMAQIARDNFCNAARALIKRNNEGVPVVFEKEDVINFLNHRITDFLIRMNEGELNDADAKYIASLFHVINDIERIGDHAVNLAEAAQKNLSDGYHFSPTAEEELKNLFNNVITLMDRSIHAFTLQRLDKQEGQALYELEEHIDELALACQNGHIFRLNAKECNTEAGMLFLNTINDFERAADHAINIAFLARAK